MDIRFRNEKVEIIFNNIDKDTIHNKEEMDCIMKIIELFKSFDSTEIKTIINDNDVKSKVKKEIEDRPIIRDRIPNTIDMSELEIKKAVTEEPMIRCPHCGQSSVVIVDISNTERYMLRKTIKNGKETFETILLMEDDNQLNNMIRKDDVDKLDYYNDIVKIKPFKNVKDSDINVDNDTDLICPMCNQKFKFKSWVDAFKDPLSFGFESESPCDVCGGETVEAIDKDKNITIKCEKCGFIKKKEDK